jgi:hypothetical protein
LGSEENSHFSSSLSSTSLVSKTHPPTPSSTLIYKLVVHLI